MPNAEKRRKEETKCNELGRDCRWWIKIPICAGQGARDVGITVRKGKERPCGFVCVFVFQERDGRAERGRGGEEEMEREINN